MPGQDFEERLSACGGIKYPMYVFVVVFMQIVVFEDKILVLGPSHVSIEQAPYLQNRTFVTCFEQLTYVKSDLAIAENAA